MYIDANYEKWSDWSASVDFQENQSSEYKHVYATRTVNLRKLKKKYEYVHNIFLK